MVSQEWLPGAVRLPRQPIQVRECPYREDDKHPRSDDLRQFLITFRYAWRMLRPLEGQKESLECSLDLPESYNSRLSQCIATTLGEIVVARSGSFRLLCQHARSDEAILALDYREGLGMVRITDRWIKEGFHRGRFLRLPSCSPVSQAAGEGLTFKVRRGDRPA